MWLSIHVHVDYHLSAACYHWSTSHYHWPTYQIHWLTVRCMLSLHVYQVSGFIEDFELTWGNLKCGNDMVGHTPSRGTGGMPHQKSLEKSVLWNWFWGLPDVIIPILAKMEHSDGNIDILLWLAPVAVMWYVLLKIYLVKKLQHNFLLYVIITNCGAYILRKGPPKIWWYVSPHTAGEMLQSRSNWLISTHKVRTRLWFSFWQWIYLQLLHYLAMYTLFCYTTR